MWNLKVWWSIYFENRQICIWWFAQHTTQSAFTIDAIQYDHAHDHVTRQHHNPHVYLSRTVVAKTFHFNIEPLVFGLRFLWTSENLIPEISESSVYWQKCYWPNIRWNIWVIHILSAFKKRRDWCLVKMNVQLLTQFIEVCLLIRP